MAEKKQRRERLSSRDHNRANTTANAIGLLLDNLEQQYPSDVDLTLARRGIDAFKATSYQAAKAAQDGEAAPSEIGQ